MVVSVSIRLQNHLRLERPLHAQTPIGVTESSFKEAWRDDNCFTSLKANGVYEAAGNAFWLNLASLPAWEVRTVPGSEISWTQLGAGRLFWSEEKFKRSAHSENSRHYNVHCSFSTAVSSSAQSIGDSFQGLPCFLDVRCSWGGGPTWMTSFELTTRQ